MKTKEQLAQDYALENFKEFGGLGRREIANKSFLSGYEAAQPKWVKVEDELPPVGKDLVGITSREVRIVFCVDKGVDWISNGIAVNDVIAWCDCIPNFKSETT